MEAQLRIEMETRVEAQVEARVQERIRVEMDVAGLQDQVGEIRGELDNAEVSVPPTFYPKSGVNVKIDGKNTSETKRDPRLYLVSIQ